MIKAFAVVFVVVNNSGMCLGLPAPQDFEYIQCTWKSNRCVSWAQVDIFQNETILKSSWPSGPYALLMSTDGCPEAEEQGWRRGYLHFSWLHDHIVLSSSSYSYGNNTSGSKNYTNIDSLQELLPEHWPFIESGMLGPFSRYAFRMNFCYRLESLSSAADTKVWPSGQYNIFGDLTGCPKGFEANNYTVKLPRIVSWKKNGYIPYFYVDENEESVTLMLNLCKHSEEQRSDVTKQIEYLFPTHAFVLVKEENATCPESVEHVISEETILINQCTSANKDITEIFQLCFYRPRFWQFDLEEIYLPQDLPDVEALTTTDPDIHYGISHLASSRDIFGV